MFIQANKHDDWDLCFDTGVLTQPLTAENLDFICEAIYTFG